MLRALMVTSLFLLAAEGLAEDRIRKTQPKMITSIRDRDSVETVVYSPNGRAIAAGTVSGSSLLGRGYLRLLNPRTLKDIIPPRRYRNDVKAIAFLLKTLSLNFDHLFHDFSWITTFLKYNRSSKFHKQF